MRGDANFKGRVGKLESLSSIQNPHVYKAVKESISRYHSRLGVRQRDVKVAELPSRVGGVHITVNGKSSQVVLNKKVFNNPNTTTQSVASWAQAGYKSGFLTKTNKPISHIVTHELSHATWNQHLTSPKAKAAGKDINKLYGTFLRDRKKKGYGKYANTNISEFFAEVATKAVHGNADRYTRSLKRIVKKYDL